MRRRHLAPTVLAAIAAAVAARAQEPPPPVFAPTALDSGVVDDVPGRPSLVVGDVHIAGVSAVQLWFAPLLLPSGSRLRLLGLRDGAAQWFDRASLADYSFVSAWFNGDRVRVELWPAAGSVGNRVRVDKARIQAGPAGMPPELICGPTDLRVLSNDPRVGRIDGCCTTWLFDERNVCTAGHCIGAIGGQILSFNVPLSDAAGNPQFPPPQDQYALRAGSLTSVNGGVGNDYAVMSTVRNSNTGRYPGEAQGSWFATVAAAVSTAPATWTVTGYGTSSVNATWSLAQKSLSGPRTSSGDNPLVFTISVTGCNSGSPVIGATGAAHGVVTHAGCSSGFGSNYGTGLGLPAYQGAVDTLRALSVAGTFASYGQGCPGSAGVPQLTASGLPDLGGNVGFAVSVTDPAADWPGILALGDSDTGWSGGGLPQDLAFLGANGCSLLVADTLGYTLSTNHGSAALTLAVPLAPTLLAARFHAQHFSLDGAAPNPARVAASNGVHIRLGN